MALIDMCSHDARVRLGLVEYRYIKHVIFKARFKRESYATFRDSSALSSRRCSEKSNKRTPGRTREIRTYFDKPYFAKVPNTYLEMPCISLPNMTIRKTHADLNCLLNSDF